MGVGGATHVRLRHVVEQRGEADGQVRAGVGRSLDDREDVLVERERLPGRGGHVPANGLNPAPTLPRDLPGVLLAAVAGIGLGIVLGPEAPLMALGGALGAIMIRAVRSDAPDEAAALMASAGVFAALSFLFGSPLIAAVIVIEAAAIGGSRLPVVLVPGLGAFPRGWDVAVQVSRHGCVVRRRGRAEPGTRVAPTLPQLDEVDDPDVP